MLEHELTTVQKVVAIGLHEVATLVAVFEFHNTLKVWFSVIVIALEQVVIHAIYRGKELQSVVWLLQIYLHILNVVDVTLQL